MLLIMSIIWINFFSFPSTKCFCKKCSSTDCYIIIQIKIVPETTKIACSESRHYKCDDEVLESIVLQRTTTISSEICLVPF